MRAVLLLLPLAGCGLFDDRIIIQPCNPVTLAEYTPAQQEQMATALRAMAPDAPLALAMEHYGLVRAVLRGQPACFSTVPEPAHLPPTS